MRPSLLVALLGSVTSLGVQADEPIQADKDDACLTLNNRILGPRSGDRLLPLLAGDPAHGFREACAVLWSTLSPKNQALPVVGCFRGNLLQVANDAACGKSTGPLWVSARWVVTSADLQHHEKLVVVCQQLETNAWAGTRDFSFDCELRKKELQVAPAGASEGARAGDEPPKSAPANPEH
jgi:hypothetical protein